MSGNDEVASWDDRRSLLKLQWSELTDNDLDGIRGNRLELEVLLKRYYGYDDSKARSEVDAWIRQFE